MMKLIFLCLEYVKDYKNAKKNVIKLLEQRIRTINRIEWNGIKKKMKHKS